MPAVIGAQVPFALPVRAIVQAMQVPPQGVSQQTPFTHEPLMQSLGLLHTPPPVLLLVLDPLLVLLLLVPLPVLLLELDPPPVPGLFVLEQPVPAEASAVASTTAVSV